MSETNPGEPRLREHPVTRFEGEQLVLDLDAAVEQLKNEPHPAIDGHRQIALYHYGSVTKVLFAFEQGGSLEKHAANGVVSIHVLKGALTVTADGQAHALQPGQILMLRPNVPHDVRADEESQMLLTVHLHGKKQDDAPHRDPERDTTEKTP
jgi:quercetin dioxygenase-like cupin family protein